MKLFLILLLSSLLCICSGRAGGLRVRRDSNADLEAEKEALTGVGEDHSADIDASADDNDGDTQEETTPQPLGIVSIKSRAIAMDRGLCKELSPYHPHYPRCQEYCKKLDHWIGMCRRESCHCIS
ncbi:uncharacterized protein LOC115627311 [Scaptodrosophila lebanonensis]|uniref:Uncharacterized protein LOC115627311 n=1 Tax=Drosophila lebanonensis TaxID=7225 RepID=A0A6J2TRY3_DROLE|nr:uncharacterized protein LOC115627311 [Scaptodrosophila lebanonensis]